VLASYKPLASKLASDAQTLIHSQVSLLSLSLLSELLRVAPFRFAHFCLQSISVNSRGGRQPLLEVVDYLLSAGLICSDARGLPLEVKPVR
jgi:hypothetical protein